MTEQYAQPHNADANDILFGGGSSSPAIKFDTPGVEQGGRIVTKPQARQEREFDRANPGKGALKFFPSGDPIMGIVVDVQAQPTTADDDGIRRIYVEGKRLKDAVRQAVIESGASGLEVGGELHVAFIGLGESTGTGNAPKLYKARYVPAASSAANAALGVTAQAAPQQPPAATFNPQQASQTGSGWGQQQPTPAPAAPAAAPAPNGPTDEQIRNLQAAGIDPATVFPGWTPPNNTNQPPF